MIQRFTHIAPSAFAAKLQTAVQHILSATVALDELCRTGPDHLADRLNGIAGQDELEPIAQRLSRLAVEIQSDDERERRAIPALLWNEVTK